VICQRRASSLDRLLLEDVSAALWATQSNQAMQGDKSTRCVSEAQVGPLLARKRRTTSYWRCSMENAGPESTAEQPCRLQLPTTSAVPGSSRVPDRGRGPAAAASQRPVSGGGGVMGMRRARWRDGWSREQRARRRSPRDEATRILARSYLHTCSKRRATAARGQLASAGRRPRRDRARGNTAEGRALPRALLTDRI
jgi:hypothetical protein